MKSLKISTVNVIEQKENIIHSIVSFHENIEGNKEAELLFKQLAFENNAPNHSIKTYIEDGFYFNGNYSLFLAHST